MLTREGARLQVFLELRSRFGIREDPDELVILDEQVIERPWGWVFPYTTRGFLSGEMAYEKRGNGLVLINRHDGSMRPRGTGLPVEFSIRLYLQNIDSMDRRDRGS